VLASCFATRASFAQAPIQAEPSTISVTEPSSDVFYYNNRWYPPDDRTWSRIALRYTDGTHGALVMPFVGWTNDDLNPDTLGTNNPAIGGRDERHLHALQYGIRAARDVQLSDNAVLTVSLDGLVERTRASQRAGSNFPLRDEDITSLVSGPGLPSFAYSTSDWISTVGDVAASLSLRWQVGRWTMVPAFRADLFPVFVDGGATNQPTSISHWPVAWEPRLSITYAPHPAVDLHASAGLYSQPPAAGDLSPDFGSPWLGPAHAGQASLGVRWHATASTTVDATGFFRQAWDVAVRNAQPTVTPGQFLVPDGRARAYGAQFIVRKQLTARLDAWLGYTIGRSEMRSGEAYTGWAFPSPNQSWTVAPQDRTHIVTGVFAYRWRGWLGSSRFRYTSGAPYTPVTGGFLSSSLDAYEPIYGAPNSGRMPAFMQADARIGRELHIGPSVGSLYFEVSNATSHHNGEAIIYSYNYTKSATVDAPLRSYLLGVRWQL
jgi:hypothetical protein